MHTVNISVRQLVEFILRSGNIDSGFFISNNRALEGTRVHQRIQKIRKKEVEDADGLYKKEVQLQIEYEHKDIRFCIEGRADGLVVSEGHATIEEIKSTFQSLSNLEKNTDHWHWAQAKCYA
ncbi:MAG: ATP-dependent DNA helicase, partial [Defluviitaleaceae bacterium]|nr:ATP-dependent DNA helicase [Defluviitaleaceae bacterium]